jgi:5-methyltetrahydrofolate--homocysteine methyltransferase
METLQKIAKAIETGDAPQVRALTAQALEQGVSAGQILNDGLVEGMAVVGKYFKAGEMYVPEVLSSAKAMKAGMELIQPHLAKGVNISKGKVVLGTVKGDIHDIGKNIVGMMLQGAGYEVIDAGIDVPKEKFAEYVEKEKPHVIGISALLTTTMGNMRQVIEELEKRNLRKTVKVIVGGAPVTKKFADEIRADGSASDAASAVDLVHQLIGSGVGRP